MSNIEADVDNDYVWVTTLHILFEFMGNIFLMKKWFKKTGIFQICMQ